MNYEEKLNLLTKVVYALHHLDSFKDHIVNRLEGVAELMKSHQDIQLEIKQAQLDKENYLKTVESVLKDLQN